MSNGHPRWKWYATLRGRLLIVFAVVLLLSMGVLGFVTSTMLESRSVQLTQAWVRNRAQLMADVISVRYQDEGWEGVQASIASIGSTFGWEILVHDNDGKLIGYSLAAGVQPGLFAESNTGVTAAIRDRDGAKVGAIIARPVGLPANPPELELSPSPADLAASYRDSLLWVGVPIAISGIVLVYVLSRLVLGPVHRLTNATRGLSQGDFTQRVPVTSSDEIGELAHTFNQMAVELERMERQRKQLFADIAHELRTPVTNAQGYLEAMRDGIRPRDEQTVEAVYRQVTQLARLIESLRLLTLADMGRLDIELQTQSPLDVLESTAEAFQQKAQAKGVRLVAEHPSSLPLVQMDGTRIAQVIGNLLENAIFHTPSGGTVRLEASHDARWLTVAVVDSGEGIPRQSVPRVFERLYRADASRSRTLGGTGLGLAIAKDLVEAHGGTIHVQSEPSRGSRFFFRLPLVLSLLDFQDDGSGSSSALAGSSGL